VPVYFDKHYADNWADAKWIYDTAVRLKIPLLAGSTLPITWREPVADVRRDDRLAQIVALTYGPLETYGFHALEMTQVLAERRSGGEMGVRSVEFRSGKSVWDAGRQGVFDRNLVSAALGTMKERKQPPLEEVEKQNPDPTLFLIEYEDGLRVAIIGMELRYIEWAAAWRSAVDGKTEAASFCTQEWRPFMHFGYLVEHIERLMHSGRADWPAERTLLTTGIMDSVFASKAAGKAVATPHLKIKYQSNYDFRQPPPAPPNRPIDGQ
jgi:hypothetical protein